MTATKKIIKKHSAKLTPKSDTTPATVPIDDSAKLREIRQLVSQNNRSTLDEDLIVCQIYMESRFDENATNGGSSAKGLMQMTQGGVQQVYKYRRQKQLGHMPGDTQTQAAFSDGAAAHASEKIFDPATNIQLGTEYMQYWLDRASSVDAAYKMYRGVSNGIYYKKISACAEKLKNNSDSMQDLRDMVK